jgi:hypothetical protein
MQTFFPAMVALPPVSPQVGWRLSIRLPRDHYVRLDADDYSVHPSVIGRRVEVTAGLEEVRASCGGDAVAGHRRCWASHQTITAPDHERAARDLRRRYLAAATQPPAAGDQVEVEQRKLTDYDRLFGLRNACDNGGAGKVAV